MLRFDTFVFKEMDGKLRLLFEEGSSYIYVWINSKFEILSFQYLIGGVIGLHYHETGALEIKAVSREPFNRALSGTAALSDDAALG